MTNRNLLTNSMPLFKPKENNLNKISESSKLNNKKYYNTTEPYLNKNKNSNGKSKNSSLHSSQISLFNKSRQSVDKMEDNISIKSSLNNKSSNKKINSEEDKISNNKIEKSSINSKK